MKNALESTGNSTDQIQEKIGELEKSESRNDIGGRRERTKIFKKQRKSYQTLLGGQT